MRSRLYTTKRLLLAPRTEYRRRKMKLEGAARAMFESQYYGTPMIEFTAATVANPSLLTDADLDESSVVIDAGAFVGDWTAEIHDRYRCQVYAIEAAPQAVEKLHLRFDGCDNISILGVGLGAEDRRATLALAGPGSSFFDEDGPWGRAHVRIRDVAEVLDDLDVEHVDLLKLNIEGGEYDVLDRLIETGRIRQIRQLSVQFHEWHPGAYLRRSLIRGELRRTHRQAWNYPWVWEFWAATGDTRPP